MTNGMYKPLFDLILLEDASDFLSLLPPKAQEKLLFNIRKVRFGVEDTRVFKKLEGTDIWEFRIEWMNIAYRLLAFWDKSGGTLVVATHGFSKKSQKTPEKEIKKAEAIRKDWFNNK